MQVAETGKTNFLFTANQNLILSDISQEDKESIDKILQEFGVKQRTEEVSALRRNAIACVAFPTCPLALAEAQRYMPELISKVEPLLAKHELSNENIIMRMTGCPNGCGRSYVAEIGFVGTAYGRYNLHLGGDNEGMRLNKIYKESLDENEILNELDMLFEDFKQHRINGESFGDFSNRRWVNDVHQTKEKVAEN